MSIFQLIANNKRILTELVLGLMKLRGGKERGKKENKRRFLQRNRSSMNSSSPNSRYSLFSTNCFSSRAHITFFLLCLPTSLCLILSSSIILSFLFSVSHVKRTLRSESFKKSTCMASSGRHWR